MSALYKRDIELTILCGANKARVIIFFILSAIFQTKIEYAKQGKLFYFSLKRTSEQKNSALNRTLPKSFSNVQKNFIIA